MSTENASDDATLDALRKLLDNNAGAMSTKLHDLQAQLNIARADASRHAITANTQQVFIREVSVFHREALLPLVDLVMSILEQTQSSNAAMSERLAQVRSFVTSVGDRSKHYESQALVEKARQAAIDEYARLEAAKTIAP